MSDVILGKVHFLNMPFYYFLFLEFIYFFLFLNYQIIATKENLKFVLKNLFWSMRSRKSKILYLNLNSGYLTLGR